jgi:hypothetical protein
MNTVGQKVLKLCSHCEAAFSLSADARTGYLFDLCLLSQVLPAKNNNRKPGSNTSEESLRDQKFTSCVPSYPEHACTRGLLNGMPSMPGACARTCGAPEEAMAAAAARGLRARIRNIRGHQHNGWTSCVLHAQTSPIYRRTPQNRPAPRLCRLLSSAHSSAMIPCGSCCATAHATHRHSSIRSHTKPGCGQREVRAAS